MAARPKRAARKAKAAGQPRLSGDQRMFMKATPTPVQDWLWHQRLGDLKTMLELWGIEDGSIDTREKAVSALFMEITSQQTEDDGAAAETQTAAASVEVRRVPP